MRDPRLSAYLLASVMVTTLLGLIWEADFYRYLATLGLVAYLISLRGRLSPMARGMLLAALVVTVITLLIDEMPLPRLQEAAERFAFFATFLASLSLLRLPARDSALVRRCGYVMLRQPPSRRYPILSLGSAAFGVILNIGVLGLVASLIDKGNTLEAANGREWVRLARRRRMLMALLRGFALAPLISPVGLGVAVILASMPVLQWRDLAPLSLGAAVFIFLVGWAFDHRTGPRTTASVQPKPHSMRPLGEFVLLLLAIVVLVFAIAAFLQIRVPTATLIGAPLATYLWLAWQRRRLGGLGLIAAGPAMWRKLPGMLGALGSEVVVLGSAGYLGHLGVGWLETLRLDEWLGWLVPLGAWNAVLGMLLVVVTAQIGLNPIISVTLLAGILPALEIPGLPPALAGVSLMVGWSLSLMSSPLTASMLILSRMTGLSSRRLGYRWNGGFICLVIPVLAGWFLLIGMYGG